jgi:WD40 repeat protein
VPRQGCCRQHGGGFTHHRLAMFCGCGLCYTQLLYHVTNVGRTQVWDLETCKCVRTLTGHKQPIQCLAIHGDFLYSTAGWRMRIWDLRTYTCVRILTVKDAAGAFCGLAVNGDGDLYVAGQVWLYPACLSFSFPPTIPCQGVCECESMSVWLHARACQPCLFLPLHVW